jgi:hypothetical protein
MIIPFVIAGFTILLVLVLVFAGYRWHRSRAMPEYGEDRLPFGEKGVIPPGTPVRPPVEEGPTWWGRALGFQRSIGLLLTLGGLWHAAAPWINGYSNLTGATASNVASGLALAAVGVAFTVLRGGTWLSWVAGAIGVWVLIAPAILGFGGPGLAMNEAVWGGPITIILAVIAGLERRFARDEGPTPAGTQP